MTQADAAQPEPAWRNLSAVERAMARRMQRAADVPIATSHVHVHMDDAFALVRQLREVYPSLTLSTLIVAAVADGLREHPAVAAVVDLENMRAHLPDDPGIGLAVNSPRGLVVPVIHHATQATFAELVPAVDRVITRARDGDRDPSQFQGGHFSITNIAASGIHGGMPIMNIPEIAILGVATAREVPIVRNGSVEVGKVSQFTIALDHRALDGMTAAAFLTHVCSLIEQPTELVA